MYEAEMWQSEFKILKLNSKCIGKKAWKIIQYMYIELGMWVLPKVREWVDALLRKKRVYLVSKSFQAILGSEAAARRYLN